MPSLTCLPVYWFSATSTHTHTHTIILAWQVKALMDPLNRHQEPIRNSGHMGGRFSEKRRIKNPATGEYFKLSEPWLHSQLMMFPVCWPPVP